MGPIIDPSSSSHLNVHSSNRPHYCPVEGCQRGEGGKGFKRKNEMIRHGLVHNSPGYICPFCPDREHKYPRPDNLQRCFTVHPSPDLLLPNANTVVDTCVCTTSTRTRMTRLCAKSSLNASKDPVNTGDDGPTRAMARRSKVYAEKRPCLIQLQDEEDCLSMRFAQAEALRMHVRWIAFRDPSGALGMALRYPAKGF